MKCSGLFFEAPYQVAVREMDVPPPGAGEVQVETLLSAISPGTELLIYRGQFPAGEAVDASIEALGGEFGYPLQYGYSSVGRVTAAGKPSAGRPGAGKPDGGATELEAWVGRLVFAFQPHQSRFNARPDALLPVPVDLTPEAAVFLPNMETAVNLVMDGAPLIGEQVVVFGQGIVGLLTTALLRRFPLDSLVTLDRWPLRRQASLASGAHASLDPGKEDLEAQVKALQPAGADLAFELSGAPEALDQAIGLTGFTGRVVIGSWYGQKRASLDLGGRFHRSRIRLLSSQVSTLAPELSGRWTKERRFSVAWEMLRQVQPQSFITHRFPLAQAAQAFALLDENPAEAIQVVFTY